MEKNKIIQCNSNIAKWDITIFGNKHGNQARLYLARISC